MAITEHWLYPNMLAIHGLGGLALAVDTLIYSVLFGLLPWLVRPLWKSRLTN